MTLRRIGKILAGIIVLILIALIAIPFFIPADYLKGQLITQVKKATGRDLIIHGKTSLRLFPTIAVSVEDVTLGNPQGFVSPFLVHIDKLQTGAALKPLLSKRLEITGITLDGMQLNLEEAKTGAKNWEFTLEKAKAETQAKVEANPAPASALANFTLGDVSVKNSTVNYLKADAKPIVARDVALTVTGADGGKPLKLDGSLHYQNEPLEAHVTVEQLKTLLAGKSTAINANVSLPYGSSIVFIGNASMQDASGALTFHIAQLPTLLAWATGKPAAAGLPKLIHLETKLTAKNMQEFTLDALALTVDSLTAKGKVAANLVHPVPAISGALQIGTLDLNALTAGAPATSAETTSPAPTAARVEGWSDAPIDASALRSVDANLALAVDTLKSGALVVTKLALQADLKGGVLKLGLANASLYSGTAKGTVTLDGSSAALGLATNLAVSGVQIDPLMTALSGTSRLKGLANVNLDVTGRGSSERAIIGSLGGTASLKVTNGAVKGINIAQFMRTAKQGFLFADNSSAETDFSEMSASFTLAQGIVTNKDLALKSPILRVAGSGTVSLPARTLNYRLVPTIVGTLQGQGGKDATGLAVPLVITGPWNNPSVTPDIGSMIQEGLKNPEALKQNLKGVKDQLKNFNSPKDLGRALFGGGSK